MPNSTDEDHVHRHSKGCCDLLVGTRRYRVMAFIPTSQCHFVDLPFSLTPSRGGVCHCQSRSLLIAFSVRRRDQCWRSLHRAFTEHTPTCFALMCMHVGGGGRQRLGHGPLPSSSLGHNLGPHLPCHPYNQPLPHPGNCSCSLLPVPTSFNTFSRQKPQ